MISPYGTACAGGILRRGQEARANNWAALSGGGQEARANNWAALSGGGQKQDEARSPAYARALRRTRAAKAPGPAGCAVAGARGVAPLGRCGGIALRAAPGGSPRHGATQAISYGEIML